jgi:hypothetical protein
MFTLPVLPISLGVESAACFYYGAVGCVAMSDVLATSERHFGLSALEHACEFFLSHVASRGLDLPNVGL